jgi:DNA-binding PadR family transcriptional regulator
MRIRKMRIPSSEEGVGGIAPGTTGNLAMAKNTNERGSKRVPLKPVEFLVLAALYEEPLHGYGIVLDIDERTRGKVQLRPGDVYRVIYRLRERELLEEADRRPVDGPDDERRTYYRITRLGRQVATEEAELLTEISAPLLTEGPE